MSTPENAPDAAENQTPSRQAERRNGQDGQDGIDGQDEESRRNGQAAPIEPLDAPWQAPADQVAGTYAVDPVEGLTGDSEIRRRRTRFGANQLKQTESKSAWHILVHQFKSILVILLVVATIVAFSIGQVIEGFAILAVVAIYVPPLAQVLGNVPLSGAEWGYALAWSALMWFVGQAWASVLRFATLPSTIRKG